MRIFGQGLDQLGPITAPERDMRRQEETIDSESTPVGDIFTNTNVCWRSLVGACVGLVYLVGIDVSGEC